MRPFAYNALVKSIGVLDWEAYRLLLGFAFSVCYAFGSLISTVLPFR